MSAPKHNTDWRWERKGCRVYSSEFHRGRPLKVAEVAFGELDEAGLEARGRLIAAAPDLLEALRWSLVALESDWEEAKDCADEGWISRAWRNLKAARAAIRKATGDASSPEAGNEGRAAALSTAKATGEGAA